MNIISSKLILVRLPVNTIMLMRR